MASVVPVTLAEWAEPNILKRPVPYSAAPRRPLAKRLVVAVALLMGLVAFAGLGLRKGGDAARHRDHHGPLSDHVLFEAPIAECSYIGVPEPMPGDVWMDSYPTGFLLSYGPDGRWLPMCANGFSHNSALIACRMLGYQGAASHYNAQLRNATRSGLHPGVACQGHETSLSECDEDPNFAQSWSECSLYPGSMALRLSCYGDIAPSPEFDYQLAGLFTPELKVAVRRCGSSQVLSNLVARVHENMGASGGGGEAAGHDEAYDLAAAGTIHDWQGGHGNRSGVVDSHPQPALASAPIASSQPQDSSPMELPAWTGAADVAGVEVLGLVHAGADALTDGDGGRASASPSSSFPQDAGAASCSCPTLVADLRELANMHFVGMVDDDEYVAAKRLLLNMHDE